MSASIVAAEGDHARHATLPHLSEGNFLLPAMLNFAKNRPQPELAIPGVTGGGKARRMSSGSVVRRASSSASFYGFAVATSGLVAGFTTQ